MDLWRVFKDERYFNIRTHADEQESSRKGEIEGMIIEKGQSTLKVSETEWSVGIWSTGEGTDTIKRASPFPPIKEETWERWAQSKCIRVGEGESIPIKCFLLFL